MKTRFLSLIPACLLAAAFLLAGCEGPTAALTDATEADFETMLSRELSLTAPQQEVVGAVLETHGHPHVQPAGLWFLAARLQPYLDREQKGMLFRRAHQAQGMHLQKLVGVYGGCSIERPDDGDRPPHAAIGLISDLLSDEQLSDARAIRDRLHVALKDLEAKARNGEITREEFADQARGLHEAAAADLQELLSDRQLAALEERIARRGSNSESHAAAIRQAMIDALGLTERQVGALDKLHRSQCETFGALIQRAREGGASREEFQRALARLVAAKMSALQNILNPDQFETARIHDALMMVNARRFIQHVAGQGNGGGHGNRPGNGGGNGGGDRG